MEISSLTARAAPCDTRDEAERRKGGTQASERALQAPRRGARLPKGLLHAPLAARELVGQLLSRARDATQLTAEGVPKLQVQQILIR